jgi:hypothetical protein
MNKKILGLLLCIMMISTIPLAAGMTDEESKAEPTLDVGRVWLRGLLFRCNRWGNMNHALALRLHYVEITPSERTAGIVTLNHVVFRDSAYLGRMYEVGFGLFTYIFGVFLGGLEIL